LRKAPEKAGASEVVVSPMRKQQPNGTPGKKPAAPSVKLRLAPTPLEQRSGNKPLEPSAKRQSTVGKENGEAETGRRPKPGGGYSSFSRACLSGSSCSASLPKMRCHPQIAFSHLD